MRKPVHGVERELAIVSARHVHAHSPTPAVDLSREHAGLSEHDDIALAQRKGYSLGTPVGGPGAARDGGAGLVDGCLGKLEEGDRVFRALQGLPGEREHPVDSLRAVAA